MIAPAWLRCAPVFLLACSEDENGREIMITGFELRSCRSLHISFG